MTSHAQTSQPDPHLSPGASLLPSVRRTWAPVGHPPVLTTHPFSWKRASTAVGLCYGVGGGGCGLFFHVQPGSYDTVSLIEVLKQLRSLPDTYHMAGIRRDRRLDFFDIRDNLLDRSRMILARAQTQTIASGTANIP